MSEITKSIQFICDEKGLAFDTVMTAVESALAAAYRKDFGNRQQNIKVKFDPETSDMQAWDVKEVVADVDAEVLEKSQQELTERREAVRKEGRELTEEEMTDLIRFNPKTQIMLAEAHQVKPDAAIGDILEIALEIPRDFGRMAAQTAKQVIIQKLREAERSAVFQDFKQQEGQIVHGIVQRRDRTGSVIVDLGKITGVVPPEEQMHRDIYRPGARMKFFVVSVEMGVRGPEIILSRASTEMVRVIFTNEIPEIADGSVVVKGIARDAGNRSKVAVWTDEDTIDPIGACIGQRGSRITTIIDELGGEKIDIIQFSDKTEDFVKHALSPAKILRVTLDESAKQAVVYVAADQFSLAIGRGGQNVRLAATLTGWKIRAVQEGNEAVGVSSDDAETAALEVMNTGPVIEEKGSGAETEPVVSPEAPEEKSEPTKTEETV